MRSSRLSSRGVGRHTPSSRASVASRTSVSGRVASKTTRVKSSVRGSTKVGKKRLSATSPPTEGKLLTVETVKTVASKPYDKLAPPAFIGQVWESLLKDQHSNVQNRTERITATRAVLRLHPLVNEKNPKSEINVDRTEGFVAVTHPLTKEKGKKYKFDHVFSPAATLGVQAGGNNRALRTEGANNSQENVFEELGPHFLANVWRGYDAKVVLIGDKGSGKSHTLFGPTLTNPSKAGLLPRFGASLFSLIYKDMSSGGGGRKNRWCVNLSAYMIRNEEIVDLLTPASLGTHRPDDTNPENEDKIGANSAPPRVIFSEELRESQVVGVDIKCLEDYADMVSALETIEVQRTLYASENVRNGNIFVEFRIHRQGSPFPAEVESGALGAIEAETCSTVTFVELTASGKPMSHLSTNSIINFMGGAAKDKFEDMAEKTLRKCSRLINNHEPLALDASFQEQQETAEEFPLGESQSTELLRSIFSGESELTVVACVYPVQIKHQATMKRIKLASKLQKIICFPDRASTEKRLSVRRLRDELEVLKATVGESNGYNSKHASSGNSRIGDISSLMKMKCVIWENIEDHLCVQLEKDAGSDVEGPSGVKNSAVPGTDTVKSVPKPSPKSPRSKLSLAELRRKDMEVEQIGKDLERAAQERFTNHISFLCEDDNLSFRTELSVHPGRTRLTGAFDYHFEDLGRQLVLRCLPKLGPACELLNLDGIMTVTKQNDSVTLFVNGTELAKDTSRTLEVGDRIVIGTQYFLFVTNVRGKSFGGNPEQSGAKGKKSVSSGSPRKSPGKPTRRSLSPAGSRRSSLSPPGSRRSTLKKSKIGKQGVSSAPHASANEANALYQYALREWLVGCTQALQKSVQNSIKDFVPPLGKYVPSLLIYSSGDDDLFACSSPVPARSTEEDKHEPNKAGGAQKAKTKSPRSRSLVARKAKSPATSRTKTSPSKPLTKTSTQKEAASSTDRGSEYEDGNRLRKFLMLIEESNGLAKEFSLEVLFQPYHVSNVCNGVKLNSTGSPLIMTVEDLLVVGTTLDASRSIFCMCSFVQLELILCKLRDLATMVEKSQHAAAFFSVFSNNMNFEHILRYGSLAGTSNESHSSLTRLQLGVTKYSKRAKAEQNRKREKGLNDFIVKSTIDDIINGAETEARIAEEKQNLKNMYDATLQKFYEAARHAVIEKEGVDKSNARMQREIKSLENRLRVKNQKLNDALSRSIDQYGSKTALLHDFNAVRLSRAGSRPKQHNSGAANSGPPRGRMQGSNNVSSRRTRSLERNSNISVQWQGQDAEKLELISNLEEKDAIIGQLRQQLTTISSLKQGNVYAPSDESQGDMLPLRLSGAIEIIGVPPSPHKRKRQVVGEMSAVAVGNPATTDTQVTEKASLGAEEVQIASEVNFALLRKKDEIIGSVSEQNKALVQENKELRKQLASAEQIRRSAGQMKSELISKDEIIADLSNENKGLLEANDILKKQVVGHLEKIRKISSVSVARDELEMLVSYISHLEKVIEFVPEPVPTQAIDLKDLTIQDISLNLTGDKDPAMSRNAHSGHKRSRKSSKKVSASRRTLKPSSLKRNSSPKAVKKEGKSPKEFNTPSPSKSRISFIAGKDNEKSRNMWEKLWAWKEKQEQEKEREGFSLS